jgi:hypothetical protein
MYRVEAGGECKISYLVGYDMIVSTRQHRNLHSEHKICPGVS